MKIKLIFVNATLLAIVFMALAPHVYAQSSVAPPSWRDIIERKNERAKEEEGQESLEGSQNNQPGAALPDIQAEPRGDDLSALQDGGSFNVQTSQPQSQKQFEETIRQEAYDAALTGLFPMTPEQIQSLLKYYDETTKAVEAPPYELPEPEVAVQTISLDPGVLPPVIKVAAGHVTTLNLLDATGAPWPVHDVSWAGDFEVVEPVEGGHMIRITPMADYAFGNLSIRMLTLKTPITFSLRTARDSVHYRMDARIPEFGPMAKASIIDGGSQLSAGTPFMTSVLDGTMPSAASPLDVSGVDGRTTAYRSGSVLYIRTPLSLLSPGWQSSVSSADGMNVYSLNDTPVVLLSDNGKFMRATLTEKKDIFDE